ncbi:MAG: hypothetical protein AAGM84_16520 [Pseudomonadota bacterium]
MKWAMFAVTAVAVLAGCQNRKDEIAFDGQFFSSRLSKVDGQREQFEVAVRPFSASAEGARSAGEYEAISYCIDQFGSSEIIWTRGPDAEDDRLSVTNDTLSLRGACAPL